MRRTSRNRDEVTFARQFKILTLAFMHKPMGYAKCTIRFIKPLLQAINWERVHQVEDFDIRSIPDQISSEPIYDFGGDAMYALPSSNGRSVDIIAVSRMV